MNTSAEMPRYRCHKEVWALKILKIQMHPFSGEECMGATITPFNSHYAPFEVEGSYFRHNPKVGGYYVVYKDGYKSFSPAEAFEEGYTRVTR